MTYPKNSPNQTYDYWLITSNQQTLYIGNYKSASGLLQNSRQLQNNTVKDAMSITINRVINPQTFPNQASDYWLIAKKPISFNSGELKNNTLNGAISITINRVIARKTVCISS